ncbi:MAG TPA: hypothetical protein VGQ26_11710 [Streptosporangiaceae bacterium]|nr:hypothetical protein [Streptosporangiaceae bacterium]
MPTDRLSAQAQEQLAAQETRPRPHTVQLCIHCTENPAGFWVSPANGNVVRRPWCLSCCQELDQDLCDVIPFGGSKDASGQALAGSGSDHCGRT